jgi:glycerol uptake facilitator-like aquaporin
MSSNLSSEPCTGWTAGLVVFLFINLEAPLSGMSMNPGRAVGLAASFVAQVHEHLV